MLKKISISNFRSINSTVEFSFEPVKKEKLGEYYLTDDGLLKLNIIYGPNASGKTNIIRAIDFLRDFILISTKNRDEKIKIDVFKFTNEINEISKFVIEFIEDNELFEYTLHVNSKEVIYERLRIKNLKKKGSKIATVFSRRAKNGKMIIRWGKADEISDETKKLLKVVTLHNMSLVSGYFRLNAKIQSLEKMVKFFKKILPAIYPMTSNDMLLTYVVNKINEGEITKEEIIKVLQYADFAINNFKVEEKIREVDDKLYSLLKYLYESDDDSFELDKEYKEIEVWFKHFGKYDLKFDEESAGTKRFFLLAAILILVIRSSLIIPIDEMESSMHPDLVKFFILFFLKNSKSSQLIFTTHMRELLIDKKILRKDAIWFCEKKKDGSTELFSLIDFGSEIREDSSIYNFYKYGKLGAIPNIKTSLDMNNG